jgi:hypothetical protein
VIKKLKLTLGQNSEVVLDQLAAIKQVHDYLLDPEDADHSGVQASLRDPMKFWFAAEKAVTFAEQQGLPVGRTQLLLYLYELSNFLIHNKRGTVREFLPPGRAGYLIWRVDAGDRVKSCDDSVKIIREEGNWDLDIELHGRGLEASDWYSRVKVWVDGDQCWGTFTSYDEMQPLGLHLKFALASHAGMTGDQLFPQALK